MMTEAQFLSQRFHLLPMDRSMVGDWIESDAELLMDVDFDVERIFDEISLCQNVIDDESSASSSSHSASPPSQPTLATKKNGNETKSRGCIISMNPTPDGLLESQDTRMRFSAFGSAAPVMVSPTTTKNTSIEPPHDISIKIDLDISHPDKTNDRRPPCGTYKTLDKQEDLGNHHSHDNEHITTETLLATEEHTEAHHRIVDTLRDNDVLYERGGRKNKHEGNRRYWALIMEHRSNYQSMLTRREKIMLSQSLVEKIYRRGGRFLKSVSYARGTFLYREIGPVEARLKISQALRERKDLKLAL